MAATRPTSLSFIIIRLNSSSMEWLLPIILVSFVYGVAVGRYNIPPFNTVKWLVENVIPKPIRPYYLIGNGELDLKKKVEIDDRVISELDHQKNIEIHAVGKRNYHAGDCTCVVAGDQTIIMDTGSKQASDSIINYIDKLGVRKVDLLIISHYHTDHIGGVNEFAKEFEIGNVALPKYTQKYERERNVKELFDSYELVTSNVEMKVGDIDVLFFGPEKRFDRDNNNSIVCKLVVDDLSLLLTGDAERKAERHILSSSANLEADILQVGHHGRRTSTTPEFLSKVDPEYAFVFSNGCHPHSHPDVISALEEFTNTSVYDTSIYGSIVIRQSHGEYEILEASG